MSESAIEWPVEVKETWIDEECLACAGTGQDPFDFEPCRACDIADWDDCYF
jgi:hypothetical protein